ncbi:MAG: class I SAM-dependent methyltransferase [Ktedonobacterales bacterium]
MADQSFDRRRRKESFDSVATYYDAYRPGYPSQVVDDVLEMAHIGRGSRVLEIGCGTGQLSVPIAQRGAMLTAVELGPALADIARRHLSLFPAATVEVGKFEEWPAPTQPFDAVVCANAFHWLDPTIRFAKSAQLLQPDGVLAIVHPHHVKGGTAGFSSAMQPYYVQWGLSDTPTFEAPDPADLPPMYPELDQLALFTDVRRHRFEFLVEYSSESYVGLLHTDSLVLSLDASARNGFLSDIGHLIDTHYNGHVSKKYVHEVIATRHVISP